MTPFEADEKGGGIQTDALPRGDRAGHARPRLYRVKQLKVEDWTR